MSTSSQPQPRKRGPRFKISRSQAELVKRYYDHSSDTVDAIADRFGVTKQTIYNVLKRLREGAKGWE